MKKFNLLLTALLTTVSLQAFSGAFQTNCNDIKMQFQKNLPKEVYSSMHWQTTGKTCAMSLSVSGQTISKNKLDKNFISTELKKLNWTAGPKEYEADSATGHQEALMHNHQFAIISYNLLPPANACQNEPLSACTVPLQQWVYSFQLSIVKK